MDKQPDSLVLDQPQEIEGAYAALFYAYESGHPEAQKVLKAVIFPRSANTEVPVDVHLDATNKDILLGAARWLIDKNNLDRILNASDERSKIQAKYHSSAKDTSIPPTDVVTYYRACNLVQVCSAVRAAQFLLDLHGE